MIEPTEPAITVSGIVMRHNRIKEDLEKMKNREDQYQIDSEMFLKDLDHLSYILKLRKIETPEINMQKIKGLPKDRTICIAIKMQTYVDKVGGLITKYNSSN